MKKRILLVNPPIYDFSAFDFWLKPYGLLRIGGFLRNRAELDLFDYLDCFSVRFSGCVNNVDDWGRGSFFYETVQKPEIFYKIKRYYRRFGLPRTVFRDYLSRQEPYDFVLIQTMMTYWYLGLREVIEDIRSYSPNAKIVLGGGYVTLSYEHAKTMGADLLIRGNDLDPLWDLLEIKADLRMPPLWEAYHDLRVGVLKLTDGCPFQCTYCSVPQLTKSFHAREIHQNMEDLRLQYHYGARNIAFYDDALLYQADRVLIPFLHQVIDENIQVNFHTPNALNVRFIDSELSKLMLRAGFKTFYLGFESNDFLWQQQTGGKVYAHEFVKAIQCLTSAGACLDDMTAYMIIGHPKMSIKNLEDSMRFVHSLGVRIMLSEFSPIPGTLDGDMSSKWVDLKEPLWHNKTVFPIVSMGEEKLNYLKQLCHDLNQNRIVPHHVSC